MENEQQRTTPKHIFIKYLLEAITVVYSLRIRICYLFYTATNTVLTVIPTLITTKSIFNTRLLDEDMFVSQFAQFFPHEWIKIDDKNRQFIYAKTGTELGHKKYPFVKIFYALFPLCVTLKLRIHGEEN
jgi:hypothetical protein